MTSRQASKIMMLIIWFSILVSLHCICDSL